ncbi:MAG: hypothetical protein R6X11_04110, partial [Desulfonatronovibrio sp.]
LVLVAEIETGPETLRRARRLFAQAIETPGGLRIQTIHACCASLLRMSARISLLWFMLLKSGIHGLISGYLILWSMKL